MGKLFFSAGLALVLMTSQSFAAPQDEAVTPEPPWSGIVIPLLVLLSIISGYYVIRFRWYSQALLVVAVLGAIACSVFGIDWLSDSTPTKGTPGAILLVGGIALLLASAALSWLLFFKNQKAGFQEAKKEG